MRISCATVAHLKVFLGPNAVPCSPLVFGLFDLLRRYRSRRRLGFLGAFRRLLCLWMSLIMETDQRKTMRALPAPLPTLLESDRRRWGPAISTPGFRWSRPQTPRSPLASAPMARRPTSGARRRAASWTPPPFWRPRPGGTRLPTGARRQPIGPRAAAAAASRTTSHSTSAQGRDSRRAPGCPTSFGPSASAWCVAGTAT